MEKPGELINEKREQGFFSRHPNLGLIGFPMVFVYAMLSGMAYIYQANHTHKYEEFNPRRKIEKKFEFNHDSIEKKLESIGTPILQTGTYPLKLMNLVTFDRYEAVREKAFEIAGIDENNPDHDAKRLAFYKELGSAVRETDDPRMAMYIPFSDLKRYIEENSSHEFEGWDEWKDHTLPETTKSYAILIGKAFFKADSKSQRGDETGSANNTEWNRALYQMGYGTMGDIADLWMDNIDPLKPPEEESKRIMTGFLQDVSSLEQIIPVKFPISKLESYVASK